jgi:hypothetical protein
VIRRQYGEIVFAFLGKQLRQPAVELLERSRIPFHVVAVPVLLIEIHEIHEDQPGIGRSQRFERARHAVRVVLSLRVIAYATPQEHIENLAYAMHRNSPVVQHVEQHAARRRHGVVLAACRARKRSGGTLEWPRNHPPHLIRPPQDLARRIADLIQLPQRNHFFMRRHLKYAVRRCVNNRRSGAHVLRAQFLDDFGSRRGPVAQRAAPDAPLEFVHYRARESIRKERKGLVQMDAGHLPVPRSSVLAGRRQGAAPERSSGFRGRRQPLQRLDIAQAETAQIGQPQEPAPCNIP